MLDGCGLTDNFWVFASASTNVQYTVTVIDATTGLGKLYCNPLGVAGGHRRPGHPHCP